MACEGVQSAATLAKLDCELDPDVPTFSLASNVKEDIPAKTTNTILFMSILIYLRLKVNFYS
jgi:hypothetical protein